MAGAMLEGWARAGLDLKPITVIRPSGRPVGHDVRVLSDYPDEPPPALAMLGCKPYQIDQVAPKLNPRIGRETILISILAGVESAALRQRFPGAGAIVKAMPNMPVRIGKGVTELFSDSPDAAAKDLVEQLMGMLGLAEWFNDEVLFQSAGMLTGSGPAFLFRFLDALAAAGEKGGLEPERSARLAKAMAEGAAALARASRDTPHALAAQVASPNGTTEQGLRVLDEGGALNDLVGRTLEAARARSREMAAEARKPSR